MFQSEQDLVNNFNLIYIDFLNDILGDTDKESFLLNEYDSHYGIADIVTGIINNQSCYVRNPINSNWIYPLFHFSNGSIITSNEFSELFKVSKNYALKYLRTYSEADFFTEIENDTFKKINDYQIILEDFISIEAKLRDWQKALRQAYRYKSFSNYSFILLDEDHSNKAIESIDLFSKYNIGLITMNNENYSIRYIPKRKDFKPSYYFLKANETIFKHFINPCLSC